MDESAEFFLCKCKDYGVDPQSLPEGQLGLVAHLAEIGKSSEQAGKLTKTMSGGFIARSCNNM